jgi:hypothetical protein
MLPGVTDTGASASSLGGRGSSIAAVAIRRGVGRVPASLARCFPSLRGGLWQGAVAQTDLGFVSPLLVGEVPPHVWRL